MDTLDSDLGKRIHFSVIKSACALTNMLNEMLKKKLELKRLTKAATLLQKSGFSSPQVFSLIEDICIRNQKPDGGWVSVVDTMWNVAFLEELDYKKNKEPFHLWDGSFINIRHLSLYMSGLLKSTKFYN